MFIDESIEFIKERIKENRIVFYSEFIEQLDSLVNKLMLKKYLKNIHKFLPVYCEIVTKRIKLFKEMKLRCFLPDSLCRLLCRLQVPACQHDRGVVGSQRQCRVPAQSNVGSRHHKGLLAQVVGQLVGAPGSGLAPPKKRMKRSV